MFTGMNKRTKKGPAKARGRAKGRNKNLPSAAEMNQLVGMVFAEDMGNNLEMAMMEAMLNGGVVEEEDIQKMDKYLEKLVLDNDEDEDEEEDEEDLTLEEE
jgi:hypothetical protein